MINKLKQMLEEMEVDYSSKMESLLEDLYVESISELTSTSFETIIIKEVEDIAYYAINEYDQSESNVYLTEFNTADLEFIDCQGGNNLIKCEKKDKIKPGYIVLYNEESGITVIKIK